jgi:Mg2+/citrate symporter
MRWKCLSVVHTCVFCNLIQVNHEGPQRFLLRPNAMLPIYVRREVPERFILQQPPAGIETIWPPHARHPLQRVLMYRAVCLQHLHHALADNALLSTLLSTVTALAYKRKYAKAWMHCSYHSNQHFRKCCILSCASILTRTLQHCSDTVSVIVCQCTIG